MSNEQRDQQQVPATQQQATPPSRAEFVKKGAAAAISGLSSGAARAIVTHVLGDGS
ncbi:hypothetical protein [Streptomyces sp. LUP30]|uniref:hypothetical protein n=1 Tax=Streptomyces sp. LUP30 TaxID=1890285 RepID=UPI00159F341D|nr:hypothetical protein [Streptomyces sp. LUP30]